MTPSFRRVAAAAAITLAVLAIAPGSASAHEMRKVGAFEFTVGWAHEPTYAGAENAVQLFLKNDKGDAIDDLGAPPSLKVEALTGNQKSDPLELKASFDADTGMGTHGEFDAAIMPTRPGDYTFHFFGNIKGQVINEKFTSSDKTFDSVKESAEIQFPAKDPSPGQLATNIDRLNPRLKDAKDKASLATTLGAIALVASILLGGAGIIAGVTARRR